MVRRARAEVFFVLFLMVSTGVIVVVREQALRDEELRDSNMELLSAFIRPAKVAFESDSVYFYADADDTSGVLLSPGRTFTTSFTLEDIGTTDSVRIMVKSVQHNGVFISPATVSILGRKVEGDLHYRRLRFPIVCDFRSTGSYIVNFTIATSRLHPEADTVYRYRDVAVPAQLLPDSFVQKTERQSPSLTIVVADTSIARAKEGAPLELIAERSSIAGAVGFVETNRISVNLAFYNPSLRIVSGGGALEFVTREGSQMSYSWQGAVSEIPYTVVLEGKVNREAGGKDIARASFTVSGTFPVLAAPMPRMLYLGETYAIPIKVAGLEDDQSYSWTVSLQQKYGNTVKLAGGRGSVARFTLLEGGGEGVVVLDCKYNGRGYFRIERETGLSGDSRFEIPVNEPATRIFFRVTDKVPVSYEFKFSALRSGDSPSSANQPLADLSEVTVTVRRVTGEEVRTYVSMIQPGRFQFYIARNTPLAPPGETMTVTIRAREAMVQQPVFFYR